MIRRFSISVNYMKGLSMQCNFLLKGTYFIVFWSKYTGGGVNL